LKRKVKAITRKTAPLPLSERITRLKTVQRGWLNYFRLASMWGKLRDVDGWVRNRLRYCIWKDWKKPERKRKSLIRLGVDQDHAYAWSRTRKGGWAIAQSPILNTTITLSRLAKSGYEAMLAHYQKVAPHLNPGSGPGQACAAVYETRLVYPERSRRAQWCERRTPSPQGDGAAYSIVCCAASDTKFWPRRHHKILFKVIYFHCCVESSLSKFIFLLK